MSRPVCWEGLESLESIHQDLIAVTNSQLRHVDRLWAELNTRAEDFRQLLDKRAQNDASRRTLQSGKIQVDGDDYAINESFQENVLELASILELDEIESAALLLNAQEHSDEIDRSLISTAIIRFQQRRLLVLENVRLLLVLSFDAAIDDGIRDSIREFLSVIYMTVDGAAQPVSPLRKYLQSMHEIEKWLLRLSEKADGMQAIGHTISSEATEILSFQENSLLRQHESLSAAIVLLVRASYSNRSDFEFCLSLASKLDRWTTTTIHHMPVLLSFIAQYGARTAHESLQQVRDLNELLMGTKESTTWILRELQAATNIWWLAEYSGIYQDDQNDYAGPRIDLEAEANARSDRFFEALNEGAFQSIIAICSQVTPLEWYEPIKSSLTTFLSSGASPLSPSSLDTSDWFRCLFMECLEGFVDAFITNMPDTLRRFRSVADDQRKKVLSSLQHSAQIGMPSGDLHLERFLIIGSFAFENRPEAAQSFWSDTESNLYGFLQWAAKRQSTPSAGAFCEMLRSVSMSTDCATSAHRFLLEEGSMAAVKGRKSGTTSWAQILRELQLYTSRVLGRSNRQRVNGHLSIAVEGGDIEEPESTLLLESYLQLMAHICGESAEARSWALSLPDPHIIDALLALCNTAIPPRLQACALLVIKRLLTSSSAEIKTTVWFALDEWSLGTHVRKSPQGINKPNDSGKWMGDMALDSLSRDFDLANESADLFSALIQPNEKTMYRLPFPEALGAAYRRPGLNPYIDFVLDKVFATMILQLEDPLKADVLSCNTLSFVILCLSGFDETLFDLAANGTPSLEEIISAPKLAAYIDLHPFARTMDWLFNDRVLNVLFAIAHKDADTISNMSPDTPAMQSLVRSIELMNLIMDLQSTYLNIARPMTRGMLVPASREVFNSGLASFEDSVANHLQIVVDLGLYAGSGIEALAISSLKLLAKLASSKRLNRMSVSKNNSTDFKNKIVSIMEQENELQRISKSLAGLMRLDVRDLEAGTETPDWSIKSVILDFLLDILASDSARPTLAHALLGLATIINAETTSLRMEFVDPSPLFHAIIDIATDYPDGQGQDIQYWGVSLRRKSMDILSMLWSSPLASFSVLEELRSTDVLFRLNLRQITITGQTRFDGRYISHPGFLLSDSAACLQEFLQSRRLFCAYACGEVRLAAAEDIPSLSTRIANSLLGSTTTHDGESLINLTLLDLIDFADLCNIAVQSKPKTQVLNSMDTDMIMESDSHDREDLTLMLASASINLQLEDLRHSGHLQDANSERQCAKEADDLMSYYQSANNCRKVHITRIETMSSWADLMVLVLKDCRLETAALSGFVEQTLQLMTPKLYMYTLAKDPVSIILASLVRDLILHLDYASGELDITQPGHIISERLFQVFQAALSAISGSDMSMQLREVLYDICSRYLTQLMIGLIQRTLCQQVIQVLKTSGEKTMNMICDDAFGATPSCRVSALLLLSSIAMVGDCCNSTYLVDSLIRTNFLQIMVESIETIPAELKNAAPQDIPSLLMFYEAKLSLLLNIARNRMGAQNIINGGIFRSVHQSGLFSVDPDIGIEIDNIEALSKYYRLLLYITRIICSIVLARGPENLPIMDGTRNFLASSRSLIVSTYKRQAKIGGVSFDDVGVNIEELVELFTLLIAATEFLEHENKRSINPSGDYFS